MAKHELAAGKCVALFQGGALQIAEERIKQNPEKYSISSSNKTQANLDGLSCRWNPIPNQNGTIISLIIQSRKRENDHYLNLLEKMEEILGAHLENFNPVNLKQTSYQSLTENIKQEIKLLNSPWSISFFFRVISIIICALAFDLRLAKFFGRFLQYERSMRTHSDYRKFDEVLRLVLDCSIEAKESLREFLQSEADSENLFFGMHSSDSSLMTCFVNSMEPGDHIHFIDGNDGGYAMAAKELKDQMKRAKAA